MWFRIKDKHLYMYKVINIIYKSQYNPENGKTDKRVAKSLKPLSFNVLSFAVIKRPHRQ